MYYEDKVHIFEIYTYQINLKNHTSQHKHAENKLGRNIGAV